MKAIIDSLEEVPETLRTEYESKDGRYVLKLDGDMPGFVSSEEHSGVKSRLIEFRDNNIKMLKEAAALTGVAEVSDFSSIKGKLDSIKMFEEDAKKLKETIVKLERNGPKGTPDMAALIKEQVQASEEKFKTLVDTLQNDLATEKAARAEATLRVNQGKLRETLGSQATKAGVRPAALTFILDKAEESFFVEDDKVRTKNGIFSVQKPGDPLSMKEWLQIAVKEFDFAFESSSGGGADTKASGGDRGKPGAKELVNPTPQELGKNMQAIAKGEMVIVNRDI